MIDLIGCVRQASVRGERSEKEERLFQHDGRILLSIANSSDPVSWRNEVKGEVRRGLNIGEVGGSLRSSKLSSLKAYDWPLFHHLVRRTWHAGLRCIRAPLSETS